MPHDLHGQELKPGDVVNLPCVVKSVMLGDTACNVTLNAMDPAGTGEHKPEVVCNSRLVELVKQSVEPQEPPPAQETAAEAPAPAD